MRSGALQALQFAAQGATSARITAREDTVRLVQSQQKQQAPQHPALTLQVRHVPLR